MVFFRVLTYWVIAFLTSSFVFLGMTPMNSMSVMESFVPVVSSGEWGMSPAAIARGAFWYAYAMCEAGWVRMMWFTCVGLHVVLMMVRSVLGAGVSSACLKLFAMWCMMGSACVGAVWWISSKCLRTLWMPLAVVSLVWRSFLCLQFVCMCLVVPLACGSSFRQNGHRCSAGLLASTVESGGVSLLTVRWWNSL